MNDSAVNLGTYYYESGDGAAMNGSTGNSASMPNPGDGGPSGGPIPQDGQSQTISYDGNGNLMNYKAWVYHYDAQNRLTSASNGTTSAQFYYDGRNRQIARNINGVIRFNAWDNWELVEEWSELGSRDIDGKAGRPNEWERMSQYSSGLNVSAGYLQGATGVIKSWSAASTLYYYQDKLGSTTHVANASGQLVESYHYDLYGKPAESSTTEWLTCMGVCAGFRSLHCTTCGTVSCRPSLAASSSLIRSDSRETRAISTAIVIASDQSAEITAGGLAPTNDLESAIIANLVPGSYTAVVRGDGGGTGTGVVDAYDLSAASPARLGNVATRGLVRPGDQLMIAGFITQSGPVHAVVRGIGPSSIGVGISNALPDTTLQLRD